MLSIDFRNAVDGNSADNFTCLLFRLMFKADKENFAKLHEAFPLEGEMVVLYKEGALPYEKNWEKLEEVAKKSLWKRGALL